MERVSCKMPESQPNIGVALTFLERWHRTDYSRDDGYRTVRAVHIHLVD